MFTLPIKLTTSNMIWEFCNDLKEHKIEATIHVEKHVVDALNMLDLFNIVEHHIGVLHVQKHSSANIEAFVDKWRYNLNEVTGCRGI